MIQHQSPKVTDNFTIVVRDKFFAYLLQAAVCLPTCNTPLARDRRLLAAQLESLSTLVATITKIPLRSYNTCIYSDLRIYGFVNFFPLKWLKKLAEKKVTVKYVLFLTTYGCLSSQLVSCANTIGNNAVSTEM